MSVASFPYPAGLDCLADFTRWEVLANLAAHSPQCSADLAKRAGMLVNSMAHHLRALRQSGLIRCVSEGRCRDSFWAIDAERVEALADAINHLARTVRVEAA